MQLTSVLRRRAAYAVVALIAFVGLMTAMSLSTAAHASPAYPPTGPSQGVQPVATHHSGVPGTNSGDGAQTNHGTNGGTAVTGFDALTASIVAVALLGGGLLLVTVGRRRRQS